ncbi:hypothetical protein ACFQE1_02040 [Halobium palmae]|uniref:Uncharacterized protein n=1 Tax=Halobium palmae TaxID=1776492 RepID=A0ABD5RVK2_9EURY
MADIPDFDDELRERLRKHQEEIIAEQMAEAEVDRISEGAIEAALDDDDE